MTAIVAGQGLGLLNTSLGLLGGQGQLGVATQGRSGEKVVVNAATGNLVIQQQDEWLVGVGPDVAITRTYNSMAASADDDNGDNWRMGYSRKIIGSNGASTVIRIAEDGHQQTFNKNTDGLAYTCKEGGGSFETLRWDSTNSVWVWSNDNGLNVETYELSGTDYRLKQITDQDQKSITLAYSSNGLINRITDSNGEYVAIEYDTATNKNILSLTTYNNSGNAMLKRVSYGYDSNQRLMRVKVDLSPQDRDTSDNKVYITDYTYDDVGGVSRRIKTLKQGAYNESGTLAYNSTLTFTYENGKVKTVSDDLGTQLTLNYVSSGQVTITDATSQVTTLNIDTSVAPTRLGQLSSIVGPTVDGAQQSTSFSYDGNGNVTSITDARNNVVTYRYDDNGNRIYERSAQGNVIERSFSASNKLLSETVYTSANADGSGLAGGLTTRYVYDTKGHLRFVISPEGRVTENQYNNQGQLINTLQYSNVVYNVDGSAPAVRDFESSLGDLNLVDTGTSKSIALSNGALQLSSNRDTTGQYAVGPFASTPAKPLGTTWRADITASAITDSVLLIGVESGDWGQPNYRRMYLKLSNNMAYLSNYQGTVTTVTALGSVAANKTYVLEIETQADGSAQLYLYEKGLSRSSGLMGLGDIGNPQVNTTGKASFTVKTTNGSLAAAPGVPSVVKVDNLVNSIKPLDLAGTTRDFESNLGDVTVNAGSTGDIALGKDAQNNGVLKVVSTRSSTPTYPVATVAAKPLGTAWKADITASAITDTVLLMGLESGVSGQSSYRRVYLKLSNGHAYLNTYQGTTGRTEDFGSVTANKPYVLEIETQADGSAQLYFYEKGKERTSGFIGHGDLGNSQVNPSGVASLAIKTTTGPSAAVDGTPSVVLIDNLVSAKLPGENELSNWAATRKNVALAESTWVQDFSTDTSGLQSPIGSATLPTGFARQANGTLGVTNTYSAASIDATVYAAPAVLGASMKVELTMPADASKGDITIGLESDNWGTANYVRHALNINGGNVFLKAWQGSSSSSVKLNASGTLLKNGATYVLEVVTEVDGQSQLYFYEKGLGRTSLYTDSKSFTKWTTPMLFMETTVNSTVTAATSGTILLDNLSVSSPYRGIQRTHYTYDPLRGQLATRVVYDSVTGSDAQGVTDGTQSTTQFVYDQAGNLLQQIDGRNNLTSYAYDGLNRIVSQQDGVRNAMGAGTSTLSVTTYDDVNLKTTTTLVNGLATTSAYDKRGHLIAVTKADSANALGSTNYNYDTLGRLVSATTPTGETSYIVYDAVGRKVGEIDAENALVEYRYNAANELSSTIRYASKVDPSKLTGLGVGLQLATLRPTDLTGSRTSYNIYDKAGRLIKTVDGAGAVVEYRYDGAGRLSDVVAYATMLTSPQLTTLSSATVELTAGNGSITAGTTTINWTPNANDRRTRSFYSNDGLLIGKLDADNYYSAYSYDQAGRLIKTVRYASAMVGTLPDGNTPPPVLSTASGSNYVLKSADDQSSYKLYNARNQLVGSIDAEGYYTRYQYDAAGNKASEVRYANRIVNTFDGKTLPAVVGSGTVAPLACYVRTDAQDQSTIYNYDADNRLIKTTEQPNGLTTDYTYDAVGNLTKTVKASGVVADERIVQRRYDSQGRVIAELDGVGSKALNAWLAANSSAAQSVKDAQTESLWKLYGTRYAYDNAGRRIAVITPSGGNDEAGNQTAYYYDKAGRLTHSINARGEVTVYAYNSFGERQSTTQVGTRVSTAGLAGGLNSALGNLVSNVLMVGKDSTTSQGYDERGLVKSVTDALNYTSTRSYNAFGELDTSVQRIDANTTATTSYAYDKRGNQLTSTESDLGNRVYSTLKYDAFGRLTSRKDGNLNETTYKYDRLGRQVTVVDPFAVNHATSYDAFGRVLSVTDGLSNVTRYSYDGAQRTMTMQTQEGVTVTTTYNLHGQVISVQDGRGSITSYAYDQEGKLTKTTTPAGQSEISYDMAGRVYDSKDARGVITRFEYDKANRVSKRTVDVGGLNLVTEYTFDAKGQTIWTKDPNSVYTKTEFDLSGQVRATVVDPKKGPTWSSGPDDNPLGLELRTAYTYDARGKTLTVTEGANTAQAKTTQYIYDAAGRRTDEVVDKDGLKLKTSYTYDKADNVVAKTEDAGRKVTRYVYDAKNQLIYSVDATGAVVKNDYDQEGRLTRTRAYATPITSAQLATLALAASATDISGKLSPDDNKDHVSYNIYDKDGRLSITVDALMGATKRSYDKANNVTEVRRYATPVAAPTVAKSDGNGALLSFAAPALTESPQLDQRTQTVYDAANRANWTLQTDYVSGGNVVYATRNTYDSTGNLTEVRQFVASAKTRSPAASALGANEVAITGTGLNLGDLYVVADSDNDRTSATVYDKAGRAVFAIDAENFVTENQYDNLGHTTGSIRYAGKLQGSYVAGQKPAVLDVGAPTPTTGSWVFRAASTSSNQDSIASYGYDKAGRLQTQSTTDRTGATLSATQTVYDAAGRVTDMTEALGTGQDVTTHYNYDSAGRLIEEIKASGTAAQASTRYKLDNLGRRTEIVDPRGVEAAESNSDWAKSARADLLAAGKISSSALPVKDSADYKAILKAYTTTQAYDAQGRVIQITDALGGTTKTDYDAFGNAVRVQDPNGNFGYFVFDKLNQATWQIDPLGYATQSEYDALGQVKQITKYENDVQNKTAVWNGTSRTTNAPILYADKAAYTTANGSTKPGFAYLIGTPDVISGQTILSAGKDAVTAIAHDLRGHQIKITDAEKYFESMKYDALGNKVGYINKLGGEFKYRYDRVGNLLAEVLPVGLSYNKTSSFTLKADSLIQAQGTTATNFNCAVRICLPDASNGTYQVIVKLDPMVSNSPCTGNIAGINQSLTATAIDGVINISIPVSGNVFVPWNRLGSSTSSKYEVSVYPTSGPTTLNRICSISGSTAEVGLPVTANLPQYYGQSVPQYGALAESNPVQDVVNKYEYDATGNRVKSIEASGLQEERVTTYTYDALGRQLTKATQAMDVYNTSETSDFAFTSNITQPSPGTLRKRQDANLAWDASASSKQSFVGGASVSFTPSQTTGHLAVGLTTTPNASNSYTSIDWTLYCQNGSVLIFHNDKQVSNPGVTFDANSTLTIAYDGQRIRFLKDGTQEIYSEVAKINKPLYAVVAMNAPGMAVRNLRFGATTRVNGVVTNQITPTEFNHYDAQGNQIEHIAADGGRTLSYFDALNRKTSEISGTGTLTNFTYNKSGNLIETSVSGSPVSLPAAAGGIAPFPRPLEDCRTTYYSYDANGRLLTTTTKGLTTVSQNESTHTLEITDKDVTIKRFEYDRCGNIIKEVDGKGNETYNFFDSLGHKILQVDAERYVTKFEWDEAGNLIRQTRYAATLEASTAVRTDSNPADLIPPTPSEARIVEYEYDRLSHKIEERQLAVDWATITTSNGALSTESGPLKTTFRYNGLGLLESKTDATTSTTYYKYDAIGRLTETTNPQYQQFGSTILSKSALEYNGIGLVTKKTQFGSTTAENRITSFSYNNNGIITSSSAADGTTTKFLTDASGRITRQWSDRFDAQQLEIHESNTTAAQDKTWGKLYVQQQPQLGIEAISKATTDAAYNSSGLCFETAVQFDGSGVDRNLQIGLNNSQSGAQARTAYIGFRYDSLKSQDLVGFNYVDSTGTQQEVLAPEAIKFDPTHKYLVQIWIKQNSISFSIQDQSLISTVTSYTYTYPSSNPTTADWGFTRPYISVIRPTSITTGAVDIIDEARLLMRNEQGAVSQAYFIDTFSDSTSQIRFDAGDSKVFWKVDAQGQTGYTDYTDITYNQDGKETDRETYTYFFGETNLSGQRTKHNSSIQSTRYNSYGEIAAKGVNGTLSETIEYNKAGQVWRTNSGIGGGSTKAYYYDAAGNASMELSSAELDLRSNEVLPSQGQAALTTLINNGRVFAQISVYDKLNQLKETIQPALNTPTDDPLNATTISIGPMKFGGTVVFKSGFLGLFFPGTATVTLPSASAFGPGQWEIATQIEGSNDSTSTFTTLENSNFSFDVIGASGANLRITLYRQVQGVGRTLVASGTVAPHENSTVSWQSDMGAPLQLKGLPPGTSRLQFSYTTNLTTSSPDWWVDAFTSLMTLDDGQPLKGWFKSGLPMGTTGKFRYIAFGSDSQILTAGAGTYDTTGGSARIITHTPQALSTSPPLADALSIASAQRFYDNASKRRQTVDAYGQIRSTTDALGFTTEYLYNSRGLLTQRSDPTASRTNDKGETELTFNGVTSFAYDAMGNLIQTIDANQNIQKKAYGNLNGQQVVVAEFHSDLGIKRLLYDEFGEVKEERSELYAQSPQLGTTRYTYDKLGRVTAINRPGLADESYRYDSKGQRIETTLAPDSHSNRYKLRTYYDALGRIIETTSASGSWTAYSYAWIDATKAWQVTTAASGLGSSIKMQDTFGRMVWSQDFGGHVFTYRYNSAGLLIAQTSLASDTAPSVQGAQARLNTGQNIAFSYYANGAQKSTIDSALKVRSLRDYDANGRQIRETYAIGTGIDADARYNLLSDTRVTYDSLGRVSNIIDINNEISYQYDSVGNRRSVTSTWFNASQGTLVTTSDWYTYDSMDRLLISRGRLDGSSINLVNGSVRLEYDVASRRRYATYGSDTTGFDHGESYTYNAEGNLEAVYIDQTSISRKQEAGNLLSFRTSDARGQVTQISIYGYGSSEDYTMPRFPIGTVPAIQSGSLWHVTNRQILDYNADGQNISKEESFDAIQVFSTSNSTPYSLNKQVIANTTSTYSTSGDIIGVYRDEISPRSGSATDSLLKYEYEKWDSNKLKKITSAADIPSTGILAWSVVMWAEKAGDPTLGWTKGYSTFNYDINGHTSSLVDEARSGGARTISYVNDADGRVLLRTDAAAGLATYTTKNQFFGGKQVGAVSNDPNALRPDFGSIAASFSQKPAPQPKDRKPVTSADFDQNFQPVSPDYPALSPANYTVSHSGETLSDVAMSVWGDASLWYLIADANGLTSTSSLVAGQRLIIPNKITNLHNTNFTARPYDPSAALGNPSPTLPDPPPPSDSGCGVIGIVIVIVVAIVATQYLTEALQAVGTAEAGTSTAAAGASTAEAGAASASAESAAASSGAAVSATSLSSSASSFVFSPAAFVGGAAGSLIGQEVGVLIGAQKDIDFNAVALAAIGNGVNAGFGGKAATPFDAAVQAVKANLATQATSFVVGLQRKFDWSSVAAAGVTGALAKSLSLNGYAADTSGDQLRFGARLAVNLAGGSLAAILSRSTSNWSAIAANSFGSALGDSVVEAIRSRDGQQPAGAVFNWDDADMDGEAHTPPLSPVYGRTFAEDRAARTAMNAMPKPAAPAVSEGDEPFDFRRESLKANARSAAESQAREDFRRSEITAENSAAKAKARAEYQARQAAAASEVNQARFLLDHYAGGGPVSADSFAGTIAQGGGRSVSNGGAVRRAVAPAAAANAPGGPYIEPTWGEIGAVSVATVVAVGTAMTAGELGGVVFGLGREAMRIGVANTYLANATTVNALGVAGAGVAMETSTGAVSPGNMVGSLEARVANSAERMTGGLRNPANLLLDDAQVGRLTREFTEIGGDPSILRFNRGGQTSYVDDLDIINVRGDVLPIEGATHPRSSMSTRSVLAHELGHRAHQGTGVAPGAWNDEFRASYWAAKNTPNLSEMERVDLLNDALLRAREAGVPIKLNKFMQQTLYGY